MSQEMKWPSQDRSHVVVGWIGAKRDTLEGPEPARTWRPSVAVCLHPQFPVKELHLLYERPREAQAEALKDYIKTRVRHTKVALWPRDVADLWHFREVYDDLLAFSNDKPWHDHSWAKTHRLWVHTTPSTHVIQICLFQLIQSGHLPGDIVQTHKGVPERDGDTGAIELIELEDAFKDRLRRHRTAGVATIGSPPELTTLNEALREVYAEALAAIEFSRAPILLLGPSGSGKSFLARKMVEHVYRQTHEGTARDETELENKVQAELGLHYIVVNCGALSEDRNALTSELFGHVMGGFTDAKTNRTGAVELADNGFLFLDEVGDLPKSTQASLLRVLDTGLFKPLGSVREKRSTFRLISATNHDLRRRVARGEFRADLYERLSVHEFCLPSLQDRSEDLRHHFEYAKVELENDLKRKVNFAPRAEDVFLSFAADENQAEWRGNLRDLKGALSRMSSRARGGPITLENVNREMSVLRERWAALRTGRPHECLLGSGAVEDYDAADLARLDFIIETIWQSRNQTEAANRVFSAGRMKGTGNLDQKLRNFLRTFTGVDGKPLDFGKVREVRGTKATLSQL